MNCEKCAWKNPDTCRMCKRESKYQTEQEKARLQSFNDNSLAIGLFNATLYIASHKHEVN